MFILAAADEISDPIRVFPTAPHVSPLALTLSARFVRAPGQKGPEADLVNRLPRGEYGNFQSAGHGVHVCLDMAYHHLVFGAFTDFRSLQIVFELSEPCQGDLAGRLRKAYISVCPFSLSTSFILSPGPEPPVRTR